jgi:dihydropyrimidinase
VYTGGVHGKRFSVNRFVELVSTAPAKLFGLYPRKGTIAVGADADLVVFDSNEQQVISAKTHHMRVDYSMFEGIHTIGAPKTVLSRGRPVIENGKFVGRAGAGQFVRRQSYAGKPS